MLYLLKPFAQCVQIVIEVFSTDSSESKGVLANNKPRQDFIYITDHSSHSYRL